MVSFQIFHKLAERLLIEKLPSSSSAAISRCSGSSPKQENE
jgi:hypothetical protein